MSKELDRSEHLRLGIQYINQDKSPAYISQYEEDINIIETALKKLEQPKEIVGTTTVSKATEECLLNWCPEIKKKLKAFEIIKEKRVDVWVLAYALTLKDYNEVNVYTKLTQEEFNLLKEVLL